MFGKPTRNKISSQVNTVIAQGTEIRGDIVFSGGIHVDGKIKGNVIADAETGNATLILGELGVIEGEVMVPDVILNGSVLGNVNASHRLELGTQAKISGSVSYHLIEMAIGAEVNGNLNHVPNDNLAGSQKKGRARFVAENAPRKIEQIAPETGHGVLAKS